MIKVQFYGVVRLQTGVVSFETDEVSVPTLRDLRESLPGISRKDANDLLVLVNGSRVKNNYHFSDGDLVVFLSPAGGG